MHRFYDYFLHQNLFFLYSRGLRDPFSFFYSIIDVSSHAIHKFTKFYSLFSSLRRSDCQSLRYWAYFQRFFTRFILKAILVNHFAMPLRQATLLGHFTRPPCQTISLGHCIGHFSHHIIPLNSHNHLPTTSVISHIQSIRQCSITRCTEKEPSHRNEPHQSNVFEGANMFCIVSQQRQHVVIDFIFLAVKVIIPIIRQIVDRAIRVCVCHRQSPRWTYIINTQCLNDISISPQVD